MIAAKKRDEFWDYARGLGMILVVLGHTNFIGMKWIYLFHIPLFFIVSGALFSVSSPVSSKVLGKLKRLYLPNLKYGIMFLLLHNLFVSLHLYAGAEHYSVTDYFRGLIKILCWGNEELGGAMWFLRSLFFSYLLYVCYFCIKESDWQTGGKKCRVSLFFCLMVVTCGWIFVNVHSIFSLRTMITIPCIVLPFILFGQWIRKTDFRKRLDKKTCVGLAVFSMALLVPTSWYAHIDLAHLQLPNFVVYYLLGITGFVLVASSNTILSGTKVYHWIVYVGNHSIPILALHFLAFKLVTFIYVCATDNTIDLLSAFPSPDLPDNLFLPLLYALAGVCLPLCLSRWFRFAKKYILHFFNL